MSKNKNWRDNNSKRKTLKAAETNSETKSEEVDDSKWVLSDITFTFRAAPDRFQHHSMLDTKSITEYSTIKGILDATGARMQVSYAETLTATDTIMTKITKS